MLKKVSAIVFGVCLAILVGLGVMHVLYEEPIDEAFLEEFDDFDAWEKVSADPVTFKVSLEGAEAGYLVFDEHYGYQSNIVIATLVGMDGTVVDVRTYAQNETPSYYRKLLGGGFFKDNFIGDPVAEGFSIDTNVDAISHATISSNAVTNAVQKGTAFVSEEYLGQEATPAGNQGVKFGIADAALIGMFVLALVATRFIKVKWLQWLVRVYSIVMMGFVAAQFITLSVLVAFFTMDWPSVQDYLRWYIMVFGVLILLIATGKNTYCSHMCPFGALQEIEFALAGSLARTSIDRRLAKYLRYIPSILVFVAVSLAFITHNLAFVNYEPFSLIFGQVGVGIQWALLPLVLLGSLMLRRFYCRFACPVGYVLNKGVIARNKVVSKVWPKKKKSSKA